MQLRIEHTKSRSKDPLKEFAPEPVAPRPRDVVRPKTPQAPPPPAPAPARFAHAVSGTPQHPDGRLLTIASAAAIIQAPLVAMWLMGVPSPLAARTAASSVSGATAVLRPAHTAEAGADRVEAVAFLTPVNAAGTLRIETQPAGTPVSLDGVYRGRAPLVLDDVPMGAHTVVAQFGGRTVERVVTIGSGAVVPVLFTSPAVTNDARGRLLVESSIPLQVYENGALIGSSNGPALTLPVGDHLLEFGDDALGFRVPRTVRVTADTMAHVGIELPFAPLAIDAQPWGEVWVDGTPVGTTPLLSLTWPIGRRQVRVRHPEFGERLVSVLVTRRAAARVDVDLRAN